MKKKFLIVTNHSYMLWQFRRELIVELLKQGEVVISTPFVGHEDDFIAMGCRCIPTEIDRRGINPLKDFKLYWFYRKLLKRERPDMVITYSIKPNIYAGYACRSLNIPYVVNVQGLGTAFQKSVISQVVTFMYKIALGGARTCLFENDANADEFVNRKIIKKKNKTVLHGAGVNLDYYPVQPYPKEENGIHFLFLGRIMSEKGVDELFAAACALKDQYGDKVVFDLVGFFEDEYKETVEKLTEENIVCFHGFQTDPRPYYAAAHCVVVPSYHEGMCNVLLEGAATGRTLIASDIPGCRESIDEGVNGFLCRKKDVESLRSCMERFMSLTTAQRKNMGVSGRHKMEREFDRDQVVQSTLTIIGE